MAKYAGSIYRGTYYGNAPRIVYSVEPLEASAISYSEVSLTWFLPQGDFTKIRLIRNNNNFPESQEDGTIIWEQTSTSNLSGLVERDRFIDGVDNLSDENSYALPQGQFVYYSMYLFTSTETWLNAGNALTLIPENKNGTDILYNLIPRVFTTYENSPTDVPDKNLFLYAFLDGFGFTYDQILTYAKLISPSFGDSKIPPQFIGPKFYSYGLYPERGIPYKNQKQLIRESVRLFATKGTTIGISNYIETVTGYAPTITESPNRLLDTADSSFTKSIGRWSVRAGTLTADTTQAAPTGTNAVDTTWAGKVITSLPTVTFKQRTNQVATLTTGTAHGLEVGDSVVVAGVDSNYNGTHTVTGVPTPTTFTYATISGDMISTAVSPVGSAAGGSSISLGRTFNGYSAITAGVPVEAATSYRVSYYAKSVANGEVRPAIYWYDDKGVQIGSRVLGTALGTIGQYQRGTATATAPAGAKYAGIRLYFTIQGTYYVDMVQFGISDLLTDFDEARGLDLFLQPRKVNLVNNPSFETNSNGWTTNSSKALVADSPDSLPGSQALRLSGQNSLSFTTIVATSTTYKIKEDETYAFSMYLKASAPCTVVLTLAANDESGPDSQNASEIVELTTSWKRYQVSLYVPEGLSPSGTITMTASLTGTLTGQTVTVDNVQVEPGFISTEYFDGSMPADFGVIWQGTAHASKSFYYLAKNIKIPRLLLTLEDWIPKHIPWRLRTYGGLEGISS